MLAWLGWCCWKVTWNMSSYLENAWCGRCILRCSHRAARGYKLKESDLPCPWWGRVCWCSHTCKSIRRTSLLCVWFAYLINIVYSAISLHSGVIPLHSGSTHPLTQQWTQGNQCVICRSLVPQQFERVAKWLGCRPGDRWLLICHSLHHPGVEGRPVYCYGPGELDVECVCKLSHRRLLQGTYWIYDWVCDGKGQWRMWLANIDSCLICCCLWWWQPRNHNNENMVMAMYIVCMRHLVLFDSGCNQILISPIQMVSAWRAG